MSRRPGELWIVKPPGQLCGQGIRLASEPGEVGVTPAAPDCTVHWLQVLDTRLVRVEWSGPACKKVINRLLQLLADVATR